METKICRDCGEEKPLNEFNKGKNICKECGKKRSKAWRTKYPEKVRNYQRTPERIYQNLLNRSKAAGRELEMTEEQFIGWCHENERICKYCNISENNMVKLNWGREGSHRLTVDRIDNDIWYLVDNIVWACPVCNTTKNKYLDEKIMGQIGQDYFKPKWEAELNNGNN